MGEICKANEIVLCLADRLEGSHPLYEVEGESFLPHLENDDEITKDHRPQRS